MDIQFEVIDGRWFEFESQDDWKSLVGDQGFSKGARGYVRKNDKQPGYYDVLYGRQEFIHGIYIREREAQTLLRPLRVMKEQNRINKLWSAYWKAKYINGSKAT